MRKMNEGAFVGTIIGMVFTSIFPWIAGFLSALGEVQGPFYVQIAISNAVMILLFSLPLCLALLYHLYESFKRANYEKFL